MRILKIFSLLFFCVFLVACGGGSSGTPEHEEPFTSGATGNRTPDENLFNVFDMSLQAQQVSNASNLTGLWVFYAKGVSSVDTEVSGGATDSNRTLFLAVTIGGIQEYANGELYLSTCSSENPLTLKPNTQGQRNNGVVNIVDALQSRQLFKDILVFSNLDDVSSIPLSGQVTGNSLIEFDEVSYQDNSGYHTGSVNVHLRARKIKETFVGKIGEIALDGGSPFPARCYEYERIRHQNISTYLGKETPSDYIQSMLTVKGETRSSGNRESQYFIYGTVEMNTAGVDWQSFDFNGVEDSDDVNLHTGLADVLNVVVQSTGVLPTKLDVTGQKKLGNPSLSGWVLVDVLPGG